MDGAHGYRDVVPVPYAIARFNRRVTNRFVEPIVRRTRGFAFIHHVGRRSGRSYRTPVVLFPLDGDHIVVLTYGTRADWFQNALAAESAVEHHGERRSITQIRRVGRHVVWPALPRLVRVGLRVLTVRDFARLTVELN